MSAFGDYWLQVWDAIVAEVQKVTELEESTFYGEKEPPLKSPSAYVCPIDIYTKPTTPRLSGFLIPFDIGIMKKGSDMKQGMKDAMNLAGKVYEQLIDDRTLGDLVDNLEVRIQPYWRGKREFERHWVGVIVTCERIRM